MWPFSHDLTRGVWAEVVLGAVLQIIAMSINLFGLSLLQSRANGPEVVDAFVLFFATGVLATYATGFLANYASAKVDIDLRARLMRIKGVPASRANNDVSVSVGVIPFYIFVPGQTVACIAYVVQLVRLDPTSSAIVLLGLAIASVPLLRYVRWRGRMIGRVRMARNNLLDDHVSSLSQRSEQLSHYRRSYLDFVCFDAALGLLFILVMVGLLWVASAQVSTGNGLAALVTMVLVLFQVRSLAAAFSLFQENRKSALAIVKDLRSSEG